MAHLLALALVFVSIAAPRAHGQSFNLDVGLADTLPEATYGGAAASPGHWQAIDFATAATVALTTLDGDPSAVTITASAPLAAVSATTRGCSKTCDG